MNVQAPLGSCQCSGRNLRPCTKSNAAFQFSRPHRTHKALLPHAQAAAGSSSWQGVQDAVELRRQALRIELLDKIGQLGTQAILPGKPQEKAQVDALVERLKELPPPTSRTGPMSFAVQAEQQLYGSWQLIYASNGTAVTRTAFAQALINASTQLPGIGVADIRQTLQKDADGVLANNEAEFGLGPFGSWRIAIEGRWKAPVRAATGDVSTVKVVFERFKVKPVAMLGLSLPEWLPQLLLSLGGDDGARGGADWYTTYLDDEVRVGEGKSGNLFVFKKRSP